MAIKVVELFAGVGGFRIGLGYGIVAYSLEAVIYAVMYFLLSSEPAKTWYTDENS